MGYPLVRGPGLLYGGVWGSHETITTVKVHQFVNSTPFLASFSNSFLSLEFLGRLETLQPCLTSLSRRLTCLVSSRGYWYTVKLWCSSRELSVSLAPSLKCIGVRIEAVGPATLQLITVFFCLSQLSINTIDGDAIVRSIIVARAVIFLLDLAKSQNHPSIFFIFFSRDMQRRRR